jgi:hypothetical protein
LFLQCGNGFICPGTRPGGRNQSCATLTTKRLFVPLYKPRLGFAVFESPPLPGKKMNPIKFWDLSREWKSSEQFIRPQHQYRELSAQFALSGVGSLNDVQCL